MELSSGFRVQGSELRVDPENQRKVANPKLPS